MNLIELSIRRTVFAWILMSALIIFGAICFNRMGVSQMPDVDFPVISISVNYEGASPEVVEAELIDPIEQNLLSIEGIEEMRSEVRQGQGSVTLNFDINRDVDVALQQVQTALNSVRLPLGVDPPSIRKRNPEESPIMFLGVATDRPMLETITWVEDFLLDQFRFLPGIGEVSIGGFSQRNLRIWPDLQKLKQADMTVSDILDALQTQHLESSAGQFSDNKTEFRVRWLGEATTPDQVANILILRRGGQIIQDRTYRIGDVARVEDGTSDIRRMARINGKQAVTIMVQKQRGGNEVDLAKRVHDKVAELRGNLPQGYDLRVNVDYTRSTEATVNTTQEKLVVAALVTIAVCFLFLGSLSGAVNILFSIPTSIIGTFIVLYFSGFTLNLFTLLALTLAISIVVDDAIMILENIVRHFRMGKPPYKAAYDGAIEILPAATAATLAVVAVFMPVVFMSGVTGKFFFHFGVTMSAAVLLSLVEAITITPMRSAAFLSTAPETNRFERYLELKFEKIGETYRQWLSYTLKHSRIVVFGSLTLFLVSLLLVRTVKQEFVPMQDQDIITLTAQTPPGSSLEATHAKALEVEDVLNKHPLVAGYFTSIGSGPGPNNNSPNSMFFPIYLKPREERDVNHQQIMAQLREQLKAVKGVRASMRDVSTRGLTTGRMNPVAFNIRGPDLEVLVKKADEMIDRLNAEGLTVDLDTDFKLGIPELLVQPNRKAMAARGVSIEAVARTLSATVAGVRQSQITSNGRRYDIRVKLTDEQVRSADDIKKIEVRNSYGLRVPLEEIVDFKVEKTYLSITRVNRQRSIGVFGNVGAGKAQGEVLSRAQQISREILPEGYVFSLEGASAGLAESFQGLTVALILGIMVAYMILAVQFNSFVHPISILVALPFSLTGALLVLWVSGVSLNLFSFIGIVVLMGIAKKNSILLVEFTNQIRNRGVKDVTEAILQASPVRLRPILMTSVATVAAALPLVIGNSMGQETRTPMGLTIIGGTVVSTLFTLFVVPSLYRMLTVFENKKKHEFDRTAFTGQRNPPETTVVSHP
ncbi:MAG TPA: efflux RND transporter permease subunit [Bdellovibrionales bacterium]|nr:efflux RND transporter permease subunit [Bdellovibrionales bacterium]